jgi:hypothetical protein
MKKYMATTLVFLCLGSFSWAQGAKATLFDAVKSQQELEIMKQILGTTLSFVAQNMQKQQASTRTVNTPFGPYSVRDPWRYSNMNAFYLYGQGAVFVIPTSNLRFSSMGGSGNYSSDTAARDLLRATGEINARSQELAMRAQSLAIQYVGTGVAGGVGGAVAAGTPAPPPQPAQAATPKPPTPPAPPAQLGQEELRKKVTEAQDRVKKSRADMEASREKFLASLGEIKAFLIEALANHGDSLTTVKPNEYITVVIMLDDSGESALLALDASGASAHHEVISVQKSWITDYKAGRLTLDAFKQKVLQYAQ